MPTLRRSYVSQRVIERASKEADKKIKLMVEAEKKKKGGKA